MIHIVARLPFRNVAREDVARCGERVQGVRGDAALVALLPRNAEVAELQPASITDEDVERRQVAMQHFAAMELAEHLQDARNLAARGGF